MTTASGVSSRIVRESASNSADRTSDTGDGSEPTLAKPTCTRSSCTASMTCCFTVSRVSPGRIRKLMTARAVKGSTLSLGLPLSIVDAVVVRSIAAIAGVLTICQRNSGPKSQRLCMASLAPKPR